MKPLLRALALGVGPVVLAAGVGMLAQQRQPLQPLAPPPVSTALCTQPPVFKTEYQREDNGIVALGQGYKFNGLALIQANLCSAGTLRITASGELGGDELPQLTVALDTATIANPSLDQQRMVEVKISHPGKVYLGFFNDYYLADVRIATLSDLHLKSLNCQDFKSVIVAKESAGTWSPKLHKATLVYDPPMSLLPCSAGQLTMKVQGRKGNGEFPALTFTQGGKVIKLLQTVLNDQTVNLSVSAEPLTIAINNPYGRTLADRNLNVQQLEFVAAPASSGFP